MSEHDEHEGRPLLLDTLKASIQEMPQEQLLALIRKTREDRKKSNRPEPKAKVQKEKKERKARQVKEPDLAALVDSMNEEQLEALLAQLGRDL